MREEKTKVYLLAWDWSACGDHEYWIIGIFSTEEKAKEIARECAREDYKNRWGRYPKSKKTIQDMEWTWLKHYDIEEYELDIRR